jgi:hypothetical protein
MSKAECFGKVKVADFEVLHQALKDHGAKHVVDNRWEFEDESQLDVLRGPGYNNGAGYFTIPVAGSGASAAAPIFCGQAPTP